MENIIKVCHFSSVHKTNDIRVFEKECQSLVRAGYRTTLIACQSDQESKGVNVIQVPESGGRLVRIFFRAFWVFIMAIKQRADIYHFHDPELLPYGLLIKCFTKAKVIYDSHECYPEDLLNKEWLPVVARRPIANAYRLLEDFAAKRFDLVVAATPYIASRFKGVAKKVVTINNYPKISEFTSLSRENVIRDGVCYVGAISLIRGIIPFLDSLDNISEEINVYVAGTFANSEVRFAVEHHRNWRRVEYFGQVSRNEILAIFKKSFAGIVNFLPAPNHEYSQPNKLFEYMAAGIPVIGSNFPLWVQIIESSHSGITVNPASAEEISNAINFLSNNSNVVEEMSVNGVSSVVSNYSWDNEQNSLLGAYSDL